MPKIDSSSVLRIAGVGEPVRHEEIDGDNWPSTCLPDGSHVLAYGDGWGVRPRNSSRKLNTGLVRAFGKPDNLQAVEMSVPYFGGGADSPNMKGCGLLATGGVLYHFVRYQGPEIDGARTQIGSKLIWSPDMGATWENDAYGKDEDSLALFFREPDHAFHTPTFLQAGRGYTDAPDAFAYLFSPREDRRRANDRLDLARVPVDRITERSAYEFFAGLGDLGEPVWTSDIAQRGPVLTLPGHVSPGDVVYARPIDRYLMATVGGEFGGSSRLVLLDSPRPWGPWTLVGAVEPWGTGRDGDHRYDPRIPSGWIREDGMSFHLVYSDRISSDKLNVQEVRLESATPPVPFEWGAATPEQAGFDPEKLRRFEQAVMDGGTRALLIARGDRIVVERYGEGFDASSPLGTASLAKSLVAGLSLLLLLQDERVRLDDPACRWIPEWCDDRNRSKITVEHLATHSSGIEDAEANGIPHDDLPGWKGEFWKRSRPQWEFWRPDPNPFIVTRDDASVLFEPGTGYAYSNPGVAALAIVAAGALRHAPEIDVRCLLRDRIFRPIGIEDKEWGISYGRAWTLDGLSVHANWGGGRFTARATARLGRLLLHRGEWQGRAVLDRHWVEEAVSDRGMPRPDRETDPAAPASGLLWWVNEDGVWPLLPRDAVVGAGAGHQVLVVIPSLDLIAVRYGNEPLDAGEGNSYWESLRSSFLRPLAEVTARSGP